MPLINKWKCPIWIMGCIYMIWYYMTWIFDLIKEPFCFINFNWCVYLMSKMFFIFVSYCCCLLQPCSFKIPLIQPADGQVFEGGGGAKFYDFSFDIQRVSCGNTFSMAGSKYVNPTSLKRNQFFYCFIRFLHFMHHAEPNKSLVEIL